MRVVSSAMAVLLAASSSVMAGPRTLLVESHSEPRPPGMDRIVATVASSLSSSGVISGDELRRQLQSTYSKGVRTGSSDDIQALTAFASSGATAYYNANFNSAATQLEQAVEGLALQPMALSSDPKLRKVRKEALLTLALVYLKQRKPIEARAVVAEAVRSSQDLTTFAESAYPPALVDLGNSVLKERAANAGGILVDSVVPGRRFVLNEQPSGLMPKTMRGLLPGPYRVFIPPRAAGGKGIIRSVTVKAGQVANVAFDLEVEDRLETDDFVGLKFPSRDEREKNEAPIACAIGKSLGVEEVIVLSLHRSPSARNELLGAIHDTKSCDRKWGVLVPLGSSSPDDATISRFALSLRTRREVEGVRIAPDAATVVASTLNVAIDVRGSQSGRAPAPRQKLWVAAWVLLGVGLATATLGAGVLPWDNIGTCRAVEHRCPENYGSLQLGGSLLGVGGGLSLTATSLLLAFDSTGRRMRTVGILALAWGAAAVLSGALSFATVDYPLGYVRGPHDEVLTVTNSAIPGGVVVGIGGALIVTGIALVAVEGTKRRNPTAVAWALAPQISPASVGLSGAISF